MIGCGKDVIPSRNPAGQALYKGGKGDLEVEY